jgi:hypothetical protein
MDFSGFLSLFSPAASSTAPTPATGAGLTIPLTTTATTLIGAVAGGIVLLLSLQSFSLEHIITAPAGAAGVLCAAVNLLRQTHLTNQNTRALLAQSPVPGTGAAQ